MNEEGDGVVEIDVDACNEDVSQGTADSNAQLPILTTFRPIATAMSPTKVTRNLSVKVRSTSTFKSDSSRFLFFFFFQSGYTLGSIQYLQSNSKPGQKIIAAAPARKGKFQCKVRQASLIIQMGPVQYHSEVFVVYLLGF